MTEIVLSLCQARRPEEAAQHFTDASFYRELMQLNSWERTLQLGRAILNSGAGREGVANFTPNLRCNVAVVLANALVEAYKIEESADLCDSFISSSENDSYWKCRLGLVRAKSLRYENRHQEALDKYKVLYEDFKGLIATQPDSAVWMGRTLTAEVQCLMSLGRLKEPDSLRCASASD